MSDVLRLLVFGTMFISASAAVLYFRLPLPYVFIAFGSLPLWLFSALRAEHAWARSALLTCFACCLAFGVLECAFSTLECVQTGGCRNLTYSGGHDAYYMLDRELGYGPRSDRRVGAKLMIGNQLIYDVVYTISKQRSRVTKGDPKGDTWLFMGCSMTFGEGVGDDETLPAFFSADLGYKDNVVNLGFHGYGAHQILRSIETDRPRPLVHGAVKQIIYTGIDDHPARAAGTAGWDFHGPRYVLSGASVAYSGPMHRPSIAYALDVLWLGHTFRFARNRALHYPNITDEDIERYVRILERSALLAHEKYGAGFTVIYWDDGNEQSRRIVARLHKTRLPIMLVSTVVPRTEWKSLSYPMDRHPKPEMYRRLAAALVVRQFQPSPAQH